MQRYIPSLENLKILEKFSTKIIILLSLLFQFILLRKYLDNQIVSEYYPLGSDAHEYVNLARTWYTDGFHEAFKNFSRTPGYPAFILIFDYLFPENSIQVIKIIQLILISLTAGIIKKIIENYIDKSYAILFSLIYILLPTWYFVPTLLAESLSTFFFVLALYVSTKKFSSINRFAQSTLISIILVIIIYLKPNNIILSLPIIILYLMSINNKKVLHLLVVILISFTLILPWIYFGKITQNNFLTLANSSGYALYYGTGVTQQGEDVLARSAKKYKVDFKNNKKDSFNLFQSNSAYEVNKIYRQKAFEIWRERPIRQLAFGFEKILISFGLKVDKISGYLLGLFSITSFISAFMLIKDKIYDQWVNSYIVCLVFYCLQSIFLLSDRRYVVPTFIPYSVIILSLFIFNQKNRIKL